MKRPKYDDIGYDPRDGSSGKPERQHVPKQPKPKRTLAQRLDRGRKVMKRCR